MTTTKFRRLEQDTKARSKRHAVKEMLKIQEKKKFSRLRKIKLKQKQQKK